MKGLREILEEQTKTLKVQYLEMTELWAAKEFDRLREWVKGYREGKWGYMEASRRYYRLPYEIVNPYGKKEVFVNKAVKRAEEHYENSLDKLVDRLEKKGLNQETLTVQTSHIGVNINTTLTDGVKTVRAFTIVAGGPVQRPHYRYLIK